MEHSEPIQCSGCSVSYKRGGWIGSRQKPQGFDGRECYQGRLTTMNEKPKDYYRVFAPGVPNVRVMSERLTEAEAQSRKREILMAYPAATVRIEKTDETGRAKSS